MRKIYKIILAAFVLRFIVAFLGFHGDVNDFYWWAKDLISLGLTGFYDHNIANATQPIYPPVTSYLFWLSGTLHNIFWQICWFLNVHIMAFPSNFIFWLESPPGWYVFNKLPSIFCDLGIIYVLYLLVKDLKNEKAGLLAAKIFAFVPVFWYNSSLWGQTESIFALPMIGAFYLLHRNKIKSSMIIYTLAVLTKPTAFFAFPVFVFWLFKQGKIKEILLGLTLSVGLAIGLYFPFHPEGLVAWIIPFYLQSLNGVMNYLVANTFNFWALFFGFDNRPDTSLFLGMRADILGKGIFLLGVASSMLLVIKKKFGTKAILILAAILSATAFMFMPRMHERYFYPVLILLLPVAAVDKKIRNIFWFFSTMHLLNLYHFAWVPKIQFLMTFFANHWVEKILIILNLGFYFYLIYVFTKDHVKAD